MKISLIKSSEIFTPLRMDGKYHLSDGMVVRDEIMKSPYKCCTIGDVTSKIYCPGIFHRNYVQSGTPFLGGGDILRKNLDSGKFLTKTHTPNHETLIIPKFCTLVTCGGTIGNTVFASERLSACWASQHVMRVIPNEKIKEGMLCAYLSSRQGYLLLTTNTYGSVIPTLNSESIASIPIPEFPQTFQSIVDSMLKESAKERDLALDKLEESIKIFDNYLSSPDILKRGCIKSKSIFSKHIRFDAQYQFEKMIEEHENQNLEEIPITSCAVRIYVGNRGKRYYVNKGIYFLSSSDMMLFNPKRFSSMISSRTPSLSNLKVEEKDILISRSGTVGNCIFVNENLKDVTVSEHALRLRINNAVIEPEYVFAYLNTSQGRRKLVNSAYGSVIVTLGEDYVGEIKLPILSKEERKKIVNNIVAYSEAMAKAETLESEAISLVEKEIDSWSK